MPGCDIMAWVRTGGEQHLCELVGFVFLWCVVSDFASFVVGLECGYPGSPAYGRPALVREIYYPGQSVGFTCALGCTLRGNLQRTCLQNGSWSGQTPICDRSLPGMEQHASSRATLALYAAEKAIDGDKESCTYTDKRKPRWIRVDLRKPHTVQAVSVTVPRTMYRTDNAHFTIYVISVKDSTTASYHKCADFNGRFSTPTVKLTCRGNGIFGSYVHIEDNRNTVDYFSACEIEIFVRRDSYECGEVERPAHSYTTSPEAGVVQYKCMHGYRLVGNAERHCLPTGQWSGTQPVCQEVVCPLLEEVPHGTIQYTGPSRGRPVQGTVANISCDYGYQAKGTTILRCLETGQWSEGSISCEPVECEPPKRLKNRAERFVLLNGSTTYGSMALFYCNGKESEDNGLTVVCREDGAWSLSVDCAASNRVATLGLVDEETSTVPNGVIIGMAVVVFLLLIVLILILLFKRKQLIRRNSAESLPSKDASSSSFGNCPPSSGDSKQGLPYENDAFYASIAFDENKPAEEKQPTVQRGILSTILFAKRRVDGGDKTAGRKDATAVEAGTNDRALANGTAKEATGDDDSEMQPVYAQVDYEEKRRSRLAKSLTEQLDCSPSSPENHDSHRGTQLSYDPELDSEPIKLRELPPIPDDDHLSGTYASLSQPPEPPPSPCVMRDNGIYMGPDPDCCHQCSCQASVMKDNALYSAG